MLSSKKKIDRKHSSDRPWTLHELTIVMYMCQVLMSRDHCVHFLVCVHCEIISLQVHENSHVRYVCLVYYEVRSSENHVSMHRRKLFPGEGSDRAVGCAESIADVQYEERIDDVAASQQ